MRPVLEQGQRTRTCEAKPDSLLRQLRLLRIGPILRVLVRNGLRVGEHLGKRNHATLRVPRPRTAPDERTIPSTDALAFGRPGSLANIREICVNVEKFGVSEERPVLHGAPTRQVRGQELLIGVGDCNVEPEALRWIARAPGGRPSVSRLLRACQRDAKIPEVHDLVHS